MFKHTHDVALWEDAGGDALRIAFWAWLHNLCGRTENMHQSEHLGSNPKKCLTENYQITYPAFRALRTVGVARALGEDTCFLCLIKPGVCMESSVTINIHVKSIKTKYKLISDM